MSQKLTCEACGAIVSGLFQRTNDLKWVGFECLPAEDVDLYPGFRQRQQTRAARADTARRNFGHAAPAEVTP